MRQFNSLWRHNSRGLGPFLTRKEVWSQKGTLGLRSHGNGRIRDRTQIRPVTAVHTKPDKLQAKKCSHGAGRIRARNYLLNFVVVMSLWYLRRFSRCRDIIAICKTEIWTSPTIEDSSDRITTAKKTFFHSFLISKNVLHIYYSTVECCKKCQLLFTFNLYTSCKLLH